MEERENKISYLLMILSMGIVGTIGIFRRYIPLSSPQLAFARGIIGAISLTLFVLIKKREELTKIEGKKLMPLIINGAFLGINWILLFEAFNYTTIATATLCYYFQPTIVLLLSPLFFKEKLTAKKLICAVTALFGMLFVSGIATEGASIGSDNLRGILLALGAAVFYSAFTILGKKIDGVTPYLKTIIQLFSAAIVLLPYLIITNAFSEIRLDTMAIILILIVGVVHTGIVYAMYFASMKGLKAQTISILGYIDPVVALLVSGIILRENITLFSVLGAALIIGSAIISEVKVKRAK